MITPAVSVHDLHVALDGKPILHGIDLEIKTGSTVAILGANGSGKSTFIRALVGAIPHSRGTIEIFGDPLGSKAPWSRIGYAPQRVTQAASVPATALETVMSGLIYGWHFRYPAGAQDRALEALTTVGLAHRAHESVQTFSGGQQQRILIARALVRDPDLLVLDEPFAGIDSESRKHIIDTLITLRSRGKTIVMVLHDIYNLDTIIDSTHIVSQGRLAPTVAPLHNVHPDPLACECEDTHA
ncbi:metal ABC transporter ATP-binding protein [Arcanobacterium buesumense]|uniref:ABC transporter ATP-binding protein n=1 Tax=Arcanobacterium buesumense TaxID=2722751 RepID=A0A6H2EJV9_9ACTO|nr:ABC transporter ATP-binding protein [Arcanobacterium buesumense]QJC21626.1 ABC transporter ATP-binding protein [Arcanobacterium buesumense]